MIVTITQNEQSPFYYANAMFPSAGSSREVNLTLGLKL